MMDVCADCGAVISGIGSRQELYESFLSLEFSNPEYGEVHFLTVGTYLIQHNRYNRDSLHWICQNLRAFLDGALTIEQIRDDFKYLEGKRIGKVKILHLPEYPSHPRIQ